MAVLTVCTADVPTSYHPMYSKNQPNSLQAQHTSCVSAVTHQGNQPFLLSPLLRGTAIDPNPAYGCLFRRSL